MRQHLYVCVCCDVFVSHLPRSLQFYVLYRGSLSVEEKGVRRAMLTDGAFFGEQALLALIDGKTNAARTASCIAVTYADICCIALGDFSVICERHPEVLQALKQESANLSSEKTHTPKSLARKVRRMSSIADAIGGIAPSHQAVRAGALETGVLMRAPTLTRAMSAWSTMQPAVTEGSKKEGSGTHITARRRSSNNAVIPA